MIKEIFVPLLHADSDEAALDAALNLARAHRAHITALVTLEHPMPLVTEFGYVPLELTQQQFDEARSAAEVQATRARARLAREEVSSEVRLTEVMLLWSEETAALHARHADISVIGGPDPKRDSPRFALTFKSLLLNSGRPVLLVPRGATLTAPPRRVVVAWKPTGEASRALHDALPLLTRASQIDVLMIDPSVTEGRHGQQPGADIAQHLARHGLTVNVVGQPKAGLSVGANLLLHMQDVDADLLVMGGYGHARWREVVLGGATHSILEGATRPVLFSH
jgi:nucleotide-binding universal stress UspA family protein